MTKRDLWILFLLGAVINLIIALLQSVPGYMDAEYYYAGGVRLHEGSGFSEMLLWNYLDDPSGLPHPSHLYWMPLASVLAAVGMALSGPDSFLAARIPFILLAACIPFLTAKVSYSMFHDRRMAWFSGLLAIFSGFYALYLNLTETFAVYMLLGLLFTQVAFGDSGKLGAIGGHRRAVILGLLAGLMHLSRADGVLWLAAALIVQGLVWLRAWREPRRLAPALSILAGYALVMGPWLMRNAAVAGALLAPGGSKALWIINYDQTFAFPAAQITYSSWLASGLGTQLAARWDALVLNLQNALAVQGSVFLMPLMGIGLFRARHDRRAQLTAWMWLGTLAFMTVVFPYAGARGGFIHSSAALTPMLWILAGAGLLSAIEWAAARRGWNAAGAWRVLSAGALIIQAALTVGLIAARVVGPIPTEPLWSAENRLYAQVDATLTSFGAQTGDVVLVKNPPGYWVATRRAAIVIPDGGLDTTLAAAQRYEAKYLILEADHVRGLDDVYTSNNNHAGLERLFEMDAVVVFRVIP